MTTADDRTDQDPPDRPRRESHPPGTPPVRTDGGEGDPSAVEPPEQAKRDRGSVVRETTSPLQRAGLALLGLLILAVVVYVVFLL